MRTSRIYDEGSNSIDRTRKTHSTWRCGLNRTASPIYLFKLDPAQHIEPKGCAGQHNPSSRHHRDPRESGLVNTGSWRPVSKMGFDAGAKLRALRYATLSVERDTDRGLGAP